MSYKKAEDILPKELIEVIQQYISGTSIYIPCVEKKIGEVILLRSSIIIQETVRLPIDMIRAPL